jgi:hypothetical protein
VTARKPTKAADAAPQVGMRTGRRRGPTYTAVHDWVLYSDVSPTAKALYAVMRSHVNDKRADDVTWIGSTALALILGFSRGDKIGNYEKELVELGAVAVEKVGMPAKKVYTVEQFPPAGYAGPISNPEWHDRNRQRVADLLEAERNEREARRAAARAKKAAGAAVVPPVSGGQAAPIPGGHATPGRGEHVPLESGRELTLGVEVALRGKVSATPSTGTGEQEKSDSSHDEHQEIEETAEFVKSAAHWPILTEWEADLAAECGKIGGVRWPSRMTRKVLGSRTVREITAHSPELVRLAFLAGAADSATVPMRMWHVDQCPHWKRAERELAGDTSTEPAVAAATPPTRVPADVEPAAPSPGVTADEARAAREAIRASLPKGKPLRRHQPWNTPMSEAS